MTSSLQEGTKLNQLEGIGSKGQTESVLLESKFCPER